VSDLGRRDVSRCYLLGRFGTVVRVSATAAGLGTPVDIAPIDVAVRGGGRECWTKPLVLCDSTNHLRLSFGSGTPERFGNNRSFPAENRPLMLRDPVSNFATDSGILSGQVVCRAVGGDTSRVFEIGSELVVSAAAMREGAVALTTFNPGSGLCAEGQSKLYAFRFSTCSDVLNSGDRPQGSVLGAGIPMSPKFLGRSSKLLVATSESPTAAQMNSRAIELMRGTRSSTASYSGGT
jgi:hypothetical protein